MEEIRFNEEILLLGVRKGDIKKIEYDRDLLPYISFRKLKIYLTPFRDNSGSYEYI